MSPPPSLQKRWVESCLRPRYSKRAVSCVGTKQRNHTPAQRWNQLTFLVIGRYLSVSIRRQPTQAEEVVLFESIPATDHGYWHPVLPWVAMIQAGKAPCIWHCGRENFCSTHSTRITVRSRCNTPENLATIARLYMSQFARNDDHALPICRFLSCIFVPSRRNPSKGQG